MKPRGWRARADRRVMLPVERVETALRARPLCLPQGADPELERLFGGEVQA